MNVRAVLQRHRALRWLAPAAALVIAALVIDGVLSAGAQPRRLPPESPGSLVAAVAHPHLTGWSGIVVSSVSLGLPSTALGAGLSLTSLLAGSHSLQVWYGGPDRQRVAVVGRTAETDVFRHGRELWQWSSTTHSAVHVVLPAAADAAQPLTAASLTPEALAGRVLAALDSSTQVTVQHRGREVADRATYDLDLSPRTSSTLVGSVHIAVDGATKLPLAVRIYPRGSHTAAVDVAFTSIRFAAPSERNFSFNPPPGARVQVVRLDRLVQAGSMRLIGSGWTSVLAVRLPQRVVDATRSGVLAPLVIAVSGTWGRGRLYQSVLVDVLVTDTGWVYAGAVQPAVLFAAAQAN